jgi:hypothetical protein
LKKNKVKRLLVPDSTAYYMATVIEAVWYCMRQWDRIKNPEINHIYGQLIFDKVIKTIQGGKE